MLRTETCKSCGGTGHCVYHFTMSWLYVPATTDCWECDGKGSFVVETSPAPYVDRIAA